MPSNWTMSDTLISSMVIEKYDNLFFKWTCRYN